MNPLPLILALLGIAIGFLLGGPALAAWRHRRQTLRVVPLDRGLRSPLLVETDEVMKRLVALYLDGIRQGYILELTVRPSSNKSAESLRTPTIAVQWRAAMIADPTGKGSMSANPDKAGL